MPLSAILEQAAFDALADETVLGKDSYIKDEKTNTFKLALDGAEAGKLATPLQTEIAKLTENNKKLLDEKVKAMERVAPFEKLGKTAEEIEEFLKSGKTPAAEELEKNHQKALESLKTSHEQALKAATGEIEAAKAEKAGIEKHLISEIKRTTIAELRNEFDMNGLADDWLSNRIDVVYDEDAKKYVTRVMENGELSYKAAALKTPKQLAEEAKANKDLAGMFNAGAGGGTGAPPRQMGAGAGAGTISVSREASKNDPRLYQNAKEQAAKTGATVVFTD